MSSILLLLLFVLSNNVLDATKAFAIVLTDPQDVVGLPDSLLKLTAEAASADAAAANLEGSRYKIICSICEVLDLNVLTT